MKKLPYKVQSFCPGFLMVVCDPWGTQARITFQIILSTMHFAEGIEFELLHQDTEQLSSSSQHHKSFSLCTTLHWMSGWASPLLIWHTNDPFILSCSLQGLSCGITRFHIVSLRAKCLGPTAATEPGLNCYIGLF